jgi:TDG/mug DNA glycosylase family protein
VTELATIGLGYVESFASRVLILGTLPGALSIARDEYYANPRNRFWELMENIAGAGPNIPYSDRLKKLKGCGIALWDVCRSAKRKGSLDGKILMRSVEVNDFGTFLHAHSRIELICFNGKAAAKIFERKVASSLGPNSSIRRCTLESSSPAHTISFQEKLGHWRRALDSVL